MRETYTGEAELKEKGRRQRKIREEETEEGEESPCLSNKTRWER